MSFTEDEGEREEGEEEQDYDSIFSFFSQFTKSLLLELPSPEDRTSAAVWIQRLQEEPETEEEKRLRVDYLKLLLFVMQRGRLIGIFKNEPPSGPLQPFPEGLGLTEMGNFLLEQAELQGSGDADGRKVTYNVEISNDLREFVAAQEIPDFGIQVYYAWSVEDPIYKWMSFDETKFPQHVRDKIRQLKIAKSEEKTNVKSGSLHGEKSGSLRKSCDSTLSEKSRVKVKSPEEIEKSLERNSHSCTNYSSQRGSMKDKSLDDDNSWSPSRKSKTHSPDAISWRETGAMKFCGQGSNVEETDDEDISAGMRRGGSSSCYSENANVNRSGGCRYSNRKRDTDTSKRLQKCDEPVANGPPQMNETSYMAAPSQRMPEKCHGKEMYSESARCIGEAASPQKPPCSSPRGFQMHQGVSQSPMKSRKSRCSAPGNQNQQDDPNKKCFCSPTVKPPAKSQCSCPCPRAEKDISQREMPCFKKKEKSQLEKTCSKPKPPCPESTTAKRPQEQPCPVVEEGMKSCSRKMHPEPPEGCTCSEDRHKQQLENLSKIGREKIMNESCPQEVGPQQQQFSCSRKKSEKRDKRSTEQPEESVPGSCPKSRPPHTEDMKRKGETCKEYWTPLRQQQSMNASCCQGAKLQDSRGPGRPCTSEYPINDLGPCHRNQDTESKNRGRTGREGEYMDKRCEAEFKDMRHSPRQPIGQEYPGNDYMPCTNKRTPPNYTYPYFQEPVFRSYKPCANICVCDVQNREEELGDNVSTGSDENLVEEGDGEEDYGVDQKINAEEECPNDYNAYEEGNAECPYALENGLDQNNDLYDGTEYPKLPPKIRPGFGLNETPVKYAEPGCGVYPEAEQPCQQQNLAYTPIFKQRNMELNYTLPSRRKKFPDPRDFPPCNKLDSPKASRYIITSTPMKESYFQPFAHSPVSTIPQSQRTRCPQYDTEDDLYPIHGMNQGGGRTYSIHKDSTAGRRKKPSQDHQYTRGPPSQLQYMTLPGEDPNENQDMARSMCARKYK